MSIRNGLLAILTQQPRSTYQLKKAFEMATGKTWILNIGQVSTTLSRLERDGLIEKNLNCGAENGIWQLTESGIAAATQWWTLPPLQELGNRSELVIKLAIAFTLPNVDIKAVIEAQKASLMSYLHDLVHTQSKLTSSDLMASLIIEQQIFTAEANLRWLDLVLARSASDKTESVPEKNAFFSVSSPVAPSESVGNPHAN